MLIEILSDRVHYWVAKIDLAAIDGQMRPIENPTVQIDVESSTRFNIKYHTEDGTVVHPPILHCSPTGSVERVICAILENISTQAVPALPTWLSPIQVRVVPVAERHGAFAAEVCDKINAAKIRCDIDDREESVGKKVREAGMDWVPYVVVIGDEEVAGKKLTVTIRKKSQPNKPYKEELSADALIAAVQKDTEGYAVPPAVHAAPDVEEGAVYLIFLNSSRGMPFTAIFPGYWLQKAPDGCRAWSRNFIYPFPSRSLHCLSKGYEIFRCNRCQVPAATLSYLVNEGIAS